MRVAEASAVVPLSSEETWDLLLGEQVQRLVEMPSVSVVAVEGYQMRPDGMPHYTMANKVGPTAIRHTADFTVYERPHRSVNRVLDSPLGGTLYGTYEPVAEGTRVNWRWEVEPQNPLASLLLPAMLPLLARSMKQDLEALAKEVTSARDEADTPGIKVPPPLIYLLPLLLGSLLDRTSHIPFLPHRVGRIIGWPIVGGGVLLGGWFGRTMRQADAPVHTDKPVPRLTTEGPFRYTRNPGYLALTMVYAGIAVLRNSLWAILLLPLVVVVIQREVIGREERYLERTFGEEYLAYKARVRRWV
jgi:protein-S-isoprenylcysteine O-methyltransferase Ste14